MALARYLTEKNFSSGASASPGAGAGEGAALVATASPEVPGCIGVSGFLLKNSIFLFNAAKALWIGAQSPGCAGNAAGLILARRHGRSAVKEFYFSKRNSEPGDW